MVRGDRVNRAWQLRGVARALLMLVCVALSVACGSSRSRKVIECKVDDDCDVSALGIGLAGSSGQGCERAVCNQGSCVPETLPDGESCDDQNPLTGSDACRAGVCAGAVLDCDSDLGPCLKATRDEATGECVVVPARKGSPCDDGNACTEEDSCQGGECVGKKPKLCQPSDDCHQIGECNAKTGKCSNPKAADGKSCDDGSACTEHDACGAGKCLGEKVECDDGLACSKDSCDETSGGCVSDKSNCSCESDPDCDDGNACNGQESCEPGVKQCKLGIPIVCDPGTDVCAPARCQPSSGRCVPVAAPNGNQCDDGDACTQSDACARGVCTGTDPVVCSALSQCHAAGTCDPQSGECSHPALPNDTPCSDGDACTQVDGCQDGACLGTKPLLCAALDACHDAGACNAKNGSCSNPNKPNGVSCSDGNACSLGDACAEGVCAPQSQVVCTALDGCHALGTCDPQTGSCSNPLKPDGASCNDALTCSTGDACLAGKCRGATLICNDGVACTVDSCSEQLGGCTTNSAACACATSADCDDKNPCNGTETCNLQTRQCQPGTALDCRSLDDACNSGVCSPATGKCGAAPKQDGTSCSDGNACTQQDSCRAGVCQGNSPVTCAASDQCHDAGLCNAADGKCSNPIKVNGAACNDGSACTQKDVCQSGVCLGGSPVVCAASDACHAVGVCSPASGTCSNPAKANGSTCDDGSRCTQTDTCQGGVCLGGSRVTCSASDQCHVAGNCDPSTGNCSNPPAQDGAACVDGSLCSTLDRCQSGVCVGSNPVKCSPSDQCHLAGSCDAQTGNCSNPAKADGATCTDGSACTQLDTCQGGKCSGVSPVLCVASDSCHVAGSCDPSTGACSNPPAPDNTPCSDGLNCTGSDACKAGKCGGSPIACNDGIACTLDSCVEPGGCKFDQSQCACNKDADCDDKLPCNGIETCNLKTLSCVSGTAVNCAALDDACNVGTCDALRGACKAQPRPDGSACDDGSACSQLDACKAGKCTGGNLLLCSASDACHTAGTCDAKTGSCSNPSKPDGSSCSDGNACSLIDTCQAGQCTAGSIRVCAPSDQCHNAGTCNAQTGACSNPLKLDGSKCDDGDLCTQTDTCQAGSCSGGNRVVCSPSDACHSVGICDPTRGSCSNPAKPDGSTCDDGSLCTKTDTCQGGSCRGASPVVCTALGQCFRAGSCDPQSGLCSNPFLAKGTACNDNNACSSGETCDGVGTCAGGNAISCPPPASVCQVAACNVTQGCITANLPNRTSCDDGNACSELDLCSNGVCTGSALRKNVNGDWADDPGEKAAGPLSVDVFSDSHGSLDAVGTYSGTVSFGRSAPQTLPLPQRFRVGVYRAIYDEAGSINKVMNLGGGSATLNVTKAAVHLDDSFTLVGAYTGTAELGLLGSQTRIVTAKSREVFVAHFAPAGDLLWLVRGASLDLNTLTATGVAVFDDGAVIATGVSSGRVDFQDNGGLSFGSVLLPGVWAVRIGAQGVGTWAELAVAPSGTVTARTVTTHEDGRATLLGTFGTSAALGPDGKLVVRVNPNEPPTVGRDVWFLDLDKTGARRWGGRLGGNGPDLAGDVLRAPAGGTLLFASSFGNAPNADDATSNQPLHSTLASNANSHLITLDSAGQMTAAALIAEDDRGGNTRAFQVKQDAQGLVAIAGTFTRGARFWSKVGFGSGPIAAPADFSVISPNQGIDTLYAARVAGGSVFKWAVQAGGDNSGLSSQPGWDISLAAHPSHALTLAGMFANSAVFGDQVPELLSPGSPETGSPFLVHLNSEAEYDFCK